VNLRRLSVVLMLFAGGLILLAFYVQNNEARRQPKDQTRSTQPAKPEAQARRRGETLPATQPATRPAPRVAAEPTKSIASRPASPSEKMRLFTNGVPGEEFAYIGSLAPGRRDDPGSAYTFGVQLLNRGAAICTLKLANHFATVADKMRHDDDPETYEDARAARPGTYKGHYSMLNPVGSEGDRRRLPMETGLIRIFLDGRDKPLEADLARVNWRPHKLSRAPLARDSQTAAFEIKIYRGRDASEALKNPLLRIVKTYTISKDDYSIAMSLAMENLSAGDLRVTLDQGGPTGLPREDRRTDLRQAAYAYLQVADRKVQNRLKPVKQFGSLKLGQKYSLGSTNQADPVLWVGQVNKFFGSMMYPRPAVKGRLEAPTWRGTFYVEPVMESQESRTLRTGMLIGAYLENGKLRYNPLHFDRDQKKTLVFDIFAGPKKRDLFSREDAKYFRPLYKDLNYIGTIDFGGCFCTFNWLSLAMMWLLDRFSSVALGNYGVAIILLVLLVRLVLHPLTKKSQVSMMRMQKLKPQMDKLKAKYADDKNALNKEMMKLQKQQAPAMLLGCLPMFLQMPIWVALYTGLNATVELRHAAFLPVWITDLAAPDALFSWRTPVMLIGNTFNLLPILLGLAMFIQQRFSPQSAQAASSPEQAQQQKMMKYMMPGMMLVFFYNAPSGLTLYIMASTFAGVLDQYFVRKHIKNKEAEEAAVQTTVRVPGKAPRSSRPKKPRGPFWIKRG